MHQTTSLHDLFHEEVPDRVVSAIVRAIQTGYRSSDECCKREYDQRVQHQAWGYHRWLKIDSELLAVGRRFGNISRFESNTEQTHIGHTELHFGRLVLTAASIPARGRVPKPAKYREMLAASNQYALFEERARYHERESKIWVAVLHVPNVARREPLHIHAAFVADDHGSITFACDLINLIEIAEAFEAPVPQTTPSVKLRARARSGE